MMRKNQPEYIESRIFGNNYSHADYSLYETLFSIDTFNLSRHDQKFFVRFMQAIELNYMNADTRVDHLAKSTFVSIRQLQRKVKQLTSRSPLFYLKDYRLTQSLVLLKEDFPIEKVIINIGFTSHNHFIKCFKEKFGITPKQFQLKTRS